MILRSASLIIFTASIYSMIGKADGFNHHRPQTIHRLMTTPELGYYFGIANEHEVPEYQIVYLPVLLPKSAQKATESDDEEHYDDDPIQYDFNAFGRQVNLQLKPNRNLVAPNFKVHRRVFENGEPELIEFDGGLDCHYLHRHGDSVAAISMCQDQIIHGLVFLDNTTFEIRPLTPRLKSFIKLEEALEADSSMMDNNSSMGIPHIVRRAIMDLNRMAEDFIPLPIEAEKERLENVFESYDESDSSLFRVKRQASTYTIELAMFFDEPGYKIFSPYMNNDDRELRDMLLAYMNGVQALYHHPSLGTSVELTLVRLDLMQTQPANMQHYNGERSLLLDSFCAYQRSLNPAEDTNPDHWDMGLYVSGLDFYAFENGRKSGVTMGLATVGGVCIDQYACVIAELGTTNAFGKPYPSAGFTSVYILAHEIGHNLGMHHDSSGNYCSKEGYIMSPSRGTNGETIWSKCSADVMTKLSGYKCLMDKPGPVPADRNHGRFEDTPGQTYGAKKQCEILLRDKDATVSTAGSTLAGICQQLQCRTPHRSGYYFAGPALEGTDCGNNKWCQGGGCVKMEKKKPSVVHGGWNEWKSSECTSGCIMKSRGYLTRKRVCDNPSPVNTEEGCDGPSFEVNICKDDKYCSKRKRVSINEYASKKCKDFSKQLPALDSKGSGLQAPHEESRLWMACAIFCRRADTGSFYTPRIDLNDLGVDPYFPDGTWCHNNGKENYYCLQHHCLPETFKFSKLWGTLGEDVPFPGNAHPHVVTLPPTVQKYLSLGPDGKPLLTSLDPGQALHPTDDDWTDHDYLELPASIKRNLSD